MLIKNIAGVPDFEVKEFLPKKNKYCLCIPIINEGNRIKNELKKAKFYEINKIVDIIICDGGSTDGSTKNSLLKSLGVNTLLIKKGPGKQGAQLRMGFWWALKRGYRGIITIDGNNKDSINSVPLFIEKLENGFDFIQGSRFIKNGKGINTPFIRHFSVKFIHAPIISITAKHLFTDTTNAFRGYSKKYLKHKKVKPFREIFVSYELLAYLSVRASQLGLKVCEVPVIRTYPKGKKIPTKINFKEMLNLLKVLFKNFMGAYNPWFTII